MIWIVATYLALVLLVISVLVVWLLAEGRADEQTARAAAVTQERDHYRTHAARLEIQERHLRQQVARYRAELDDRDLPPASPPMDFDEVNAALAEIRSVTSAEDFR